MQTKVETYLYIALTTIPTIRPKVAPIAIDGTKIPAGTLQPYVITTKPIRMMVARRREFDIRHCADVLKMNVCSHSGVGQTCIDTHWQRSNTLPPPSHSLKSIAILDVMSMRRKRLKYPISAVRVASVTASATP